MSNLYRVQITEQPEYEWREVWKNERIDDEGNVERKYYGAHVPTGWYPDDDYIEHMGTTDFIMPKTDGPWRSRSSAAARRDILVRAGFSAIVQRSAGIEWPAPGRSKVDESSAREVVRALKVLKRHGVISSVDDLVG